MNTDEQVHASLQEVIRRFADEGLSGVLTKWVLAVEFADDTDGEVTFIRYQAPGQKRWQSLGLLAAASAEISADFTRDD